MFAVVQWVWRSRGLSGNESQAHLTVSVIELGRSVIRNAGAGAGKPSFSSAFDGATRTEIFYPETNPRRW